MVQLRIMHTDPARVAEVTSILLPLIASCPGLIMGDPAELGMRGGGSRIVVEVIPAAAPAPENSAYGLADLLNIGADPEDCTACLAADALWPRWPHGACPYHHGISQIPAHLSEVTG